jgi:hypothetical protein
MVGQEEQVFPIMVNLDQVGRRNAQCSTIMATVGLIIVSDVSKYETSFLCNGVYQNAYTYTFCVISF